MPIDYTTRGSCEPSRECQAIRSGHISAKKRQDEELQSGPDLAVAELKWLSIEKAQREAVENPDDYASSFKQFFGHPDVMREVTLADLVDCAEQVEDLAQLPDDKQLRLDQLMDKNNEGRLNEKEQAELQELVRETQEITLHNMKRQNSTPWSCPDL